LTRHTNTLLPTHGYVSHFTHNDYTWEAGGEVEIPTGGLPQFAGSWNKRTLNSSGIHSMKLASYQASLNVV